MENKSNVYWENLSKRIDKAEDSTNKREDISDAEVAFLEKYLSKEIDILDIGSGTGLVINKLVDLVNSIVAVETFEGFSKFISNNNKITVINAALEGFYYHKEFDLVLSTGVMQFFKKNIAEGIYKNIFKMVKTDGLFIMRLHCGINETVLVNNFSDELQTEYFAEYRQVDEEINLLKSIGFDSVEKHDILPDTLNVWENTRHFIFVCKKK